MSRETLKLADGAECECPALYRAWLLSQEGHWRVSPAFDLTFSDGPRGQHHMDVEGLGDAIPRTALLSLAAKHGVRDETARETIDRVLEVVDGLRERVEGYAIRKATQKAWLRRVEGCAAVVQETRR